MRYTTIIATLLVAMFLTTGNGWSKPIVQITGDSQQIGEIQTMSLSGGDCGNTTRGGKDGRDGIDGRDGKDGRDGVNGKDGRDGLNGRNGSTGTSGKPGLRGATGRPGRDAKHDSHNGVKRDIKSWNPASVSLVEAKAAQAKAEAIQLANAYTDKTENESERKGKEKMWEILGTIGVILLILALVVVIVIVIALLFGNRNAAAMLAAIRAAGSVPNSPPAAGQSRGRGLSLQFTPNGGILREEWEYGQEDTTLVGNSTQGILISRPGETPQYIDLRPPTASIPVMSTTDIPATGPVGIVDPTAGP